MDLIDQAPDNSSSGIVGDENTKEIKEIFI